LGGIWSGKLMAAPRKVFRIEEMAAVRLFRPAGGSWTPSRPPATPDRSPPAVETEHLVRIAHELDAVATGTAQATQKILAAAEAIDQTASNLSAALNGKIEQGLAQDIQDFAMRIFEACNFQDLIGQRVSKVMAMLEFIEQPRPRDDFKETPPAQPRDEAAEYLHGPRLDIDVGHLSQSEIDAIFSGNN
jgi:chemotaxis protein CheZ